jgi:hypothetical protein
MDKPRIVWAEEKKVIDMTQVFLKNCCPPGNPTWLLEDGDFISAILLGASFVYDEGAYITWLASFVSSLSKESEMLARKVSFIRIIKSLPEIKRKRPELFNAIAEYCNGGGR